LAAIKLDPKYLTAGDDYLRALQRLGLDPDALFWVYDDQMSQFVLVVATPLFDFKGPYEISRTLFKAYNYAATPQEIDPFVVRLHSPEHPFIRHLETYKEATHFQKVDRGTGRTVGEPIAIQHIGAFGVQFSPAWVLKFALPRKRTSVDLSRQWQRFERNVDKLAA
jgi:hypothetical protein